MSKKHSLYTWFEEIIQRNTLQGKLISSSDLPDGPVPALFNKLVGDRISLFVEKREVTIELNTVPVIITQRGPKSFLFWLSTETSSREVSLSYLPIQMPESNGVDDVDFGFGDEFIRKSHTTSTDRLESRLSRDYVIKHSGIEIIFVERFQSDTEKSFVIRGWGKSATIHQQGGKLMVTAERNKPLPRKQDELQNLTPFYYRSVTFSEKSKAKEAHFALQEARKEGKSLIDLWSKYSEIERLRSQKQKEDIGEVNFDGTIRLQGDKVRVRLKDLSDTQETAIRSASSNPSSLSFELKRSSDDDKEEANKGSEESIFEVEKISPNELILIDPYNALPFNGVIELSIKGSEVQQKRRDRARNSVINGSNLVLRNLNLVVENRSDAALDIAESKIKPETPKTRAYLKEQFGFEQLTDDQRKAVEIALNADVSVIQGPPGTGKSTVVAAICQRLLEEANKDGKHQNDNIILLSAFQNDTVDHISSLVSTGGLPTLRVGRDSETKEGRIQQFIDGIKNNIIKQLRNHVPNSEAFRTRKRLEEIQSQYSKEKDTEDCLRQLRTLEVAMPLEFRKALRHIDRGTSASKEGDNTEIIRQLRGLPLTSLAYSDGGWDKVDELLNYSGIKNRLTPNELELLDHAPMDEPSDNFLKDLTSFQHKYLSELQHNDTYQNEGENIELLDFLVEWVAHLREQERLDSEDEYTFIAANLETILEEIDGDVKEVERAIHHYSDIIAATNNTAGGAQVASLGSVENVLLEEAARSNPLDLLIPMARASRRIIMVGDHKQLPHILERDIAQELSESAPDKESGSGVIEKLEDSLFEIIFNSLEKSSIPRRITLTNQFRTHPFLADFISRTYYDQTLVSHETVTEKSKEHNLSLQWAKGKAAVFWNVPSSKGSERKKGTSWARTSEAKKVVEILKELWKDSEFTRENGLSVGVITFYSGQRDEINQECVRHGLMLRDESGNYKVARQYAIESRERLKVGTVDAFQGKEFDVVILSTVRSNSTNREDVENEKVARRAFGHLMLDNRVNVAFSRAKSLIIAVGDLQMFTDGFAEKHVEGIHEFATVVAKDLQYGNIVR